MLIADLETKLEHRFITYISSEKICCSLVMLMLRVEVVVDVLRRPNSYGNNSHKAANPVNNDGEGKLMTMMTVVMT